MTANDARTDLKGLLDAVQAAPPVDAVEVLARQLAAMVHARDVTFLIADFSGNALIRFLHTAARVEGDDQVATVALEGSPHEQAMRGQEPVVREVGGWTRCYAPVTDRGDAIGVLELALPSPVTDAAVAFVASAAHALAYVVIANRRHTDLFERGQRNVAFSLAAEIQRRLLPPAFTCEGAEFTVAGWLEPADHVGGDTFDYSVEREALHLSITDAMGHQVRSAQLATLAVASLRNTRRALAGIAEQADDANRALVEHAGDEEFVSGLLLRVELASGSVEAVNAGHTAGYLVRDGAPSLLALEADLPFGLFRDPPYRVQRLDLVPGDRLVLLTDGMIERNAMIDVEAALRETADLHPREVVHAFARLVLGTTEGNLQDDATVLCVDWYGRGASSSRASSSGASQDRATGTAGGPSS